ncbi:imm11 family protein [Stenotrophomonas indicatrix]|uniref:imm11 family protein n=1 Tax=Stenotrophomonas indicatrix TaxID=2045451 RepID=UPI003F6E11A1
MRRDLPRILETAVSPSWTLRQSDFREQTADGKTIQACRRAARFTPARPAVATVHWCAPGRSRCRLTADVRLAFNREVLGSAPVFRLPFHGGVFCDRTFKNAMEAAGIVTARRSNGLWFEDAANC